MGYLFLAISLLAGAVKGYCGKRTSGYVNGYRGAMLANTVRMILCTLIGVILIIAGGNAEQLKPTPAILAISALSGVTTSVFVVCWLISVKKGAYMMLDVFLMLGVLVPIIAGRFVFGETIKLTQWIGIGVLIIAAVIMCSYNNSIKEKMSISALVMLIVCGVANGLTDFSQKLFVKQLSDVPISVFNFYTYVFSAAVLAVFLIIFSVKEKGRVQRRYRDSSVFSGILRSCRCAFLQILTLKQWRRDTLIPHSFIRSIRDWRLCCPR